MRKASQYKDAFNWLWQLYCMLNKVSVGETRLADKAAHFEEIWCGQCF